MSRIKDVSPSVDPNAPVGGQGPSVGTCPPTIVNYGDMTNGIPSVAQEHFNTIDEALQFAGPLIGHHSILFIEYQGLKLGVNL